MSIMRLLTALLLLATSANAISVDKTSLCKIRPTRKLCVTLCKKIPGGAVRRGLTQTTPPLVCPFPPPPPDDNQPTEPTFDPVTSGLLKGIEAGWQPRQEPMLTDFVLDYSLITTRQIRWKETNLLLFGNKKQALAGGLAGAREVVSYMTDGLGAAAATVAARHPNRVRGFVHHVGGKNDTDLVSVSLKFKTLDKGFVFLTLSVSNRLPIDIKTGKMQDQGVVQSTSWFTYIAKYASQISNSSTITIDPVAVFQAMAGRDAQLYSMSRYDDLGQAGCNNGTTNITYEEGLRSLTLPSETFDAKIELLATTKVGMLRFNDALELENMPGYNAKTGEVKFADHVLSDSGGTTTIKSRDGKINVSVYFAFYAVLDVLRGSDNKPSAVRLYNTGTNYMPPRLGSDFTLPVAWLKGIVDSIVT